MDPEEDEKGGEDNRTNSQTNTSDSNHKDNTTGDYDEDDDAE